MIRSNMAKLLDFEQTQTVADYLSQEIIGRNSAQKLVRMYNQLAIGPEQDHKNVADEAGLELFNIDMGPGKLDQSGCHDGAKIVYQQDDNRLVLYGTTTIRLVTPENIPVEDLNEDSSRRRPLQIQSCRNATCRLFEPVIALLPSQPQLFSTIKDEIENAILFQS